MSDPNVVVTPTEDPTEEQIEVNVQATLDAFNALADGEDVPVESSEDPAPAPVKVEGEIGEEVVTPEPVVEGEGDPVVVESPSYVLPENHRRSAKAQGWTDEEIDAAFLVNPDRASAMFERTHTSRTSEIATWAAIGREKREEDERKSQAAPAPEPTPILAPINANALVEEYGNPEFVNSIVGPINAMIERMQPILANAAAAQESAEQAQMVALRQVTDGFFTAADMTPYKDLYGENVEALTDDQISKRKGIFEYADALIAGARAQGRTVSVPEALQLAHDSQTTPFQKTIIRDEIRTKVTKRNAGITLRPTSQSGPNPGMTTADLESKTEDRLEKAFR